MAQPYNVLTFTRTQRIMQQPNESSSDLHERLRQQSVSGFVSVREPTRIVTPSWYTYDTGKVLTDIVDGVAVCTSTCKHEMPYQIFVGKREAGWQKQHPTIPDTFIYELQDLGRDLTDSEKHLIYDRM